jgi:2-polyprenyl-3-methyl-5-hydroxy-6-metoxy-1,4-benzoquinol methylase
MQRTSILDYNKKPNDYYSFKREEVQEFIPQNTTKLLDIGCSNGEFGKEIKDKLGAEVWGLEVNKVAAKQAEKKLDFILEDTLDNEVKKLKDDYFDCITFNDVLEHLVDPYNELSLVKPKLRKDGVLIASIPNIRFIKIFLPFVFKQSWNYTDDGVLDRTHLRFFTINTIKTMFEETGYEITKIEGINAIGKIKQIIVKLVGLGQFNDTCYQQFVVVAKKK